VVASNPSEIEVKIVSNIVLYPVHFCNFIHVVLFSPPMDTDLADILINFLIYLCESVDFFNIPAGHFHALGFVQERFNSFLERLGIFNPKGE
jgi:hypothetical protein